MIDITDVVGIVPLPLLKPAQLKPDAEALNRSAN
jgi:hypothetical protein